jgi:hypothetical protein
MVEEVHIYDGVKSACGPNGGLKVVKENAGL